MEDKIKLLNSWFVANKLSVSLGKTCYSIQGGPAKVRPTYIFDGNI